MFYNRLTEQNNCRINGSLPAENANAPRTSTTTRTRTIPKFRNLELIPQMIRSRGKIGMDISTNRQIRKSGPLRDKTGTGQIRERSDHFGDRGDDNRDAP